MSYVFKFSVHNTCNSSHYYFVESDVDSVWGNYCLLTWIQYTECVEPQSISLVGCSPTRTILIYSTTGQRYRYSGIIWWSIQFYTACVEPQRISLVGCSPTWTTDLEHNWLEISLLCYHTVELVHRSIYLLQRAEFLVHNDIVHSQTYTTDRSLSFPGFSLMHSRDPSLSFLDQSKTKLSLRTYDSISRSTATPNTSSIHLIMTQKYWQIMIGHHY